MLFCSSYTASNAASRIAWHYDGAGRLTNETAVTTLGASSLYQQLDPSDLPTNQLLRLPGFMYAMTTGRFSPTSTPPASRCAATHGHPASITCWP
jgi:hypothetical protein